VEEYRNGVTEKQDFKTAQAFEGGALEARGSGGGRMPSVPFGQAFPQGLPHMRLLQRQARDGYGEKRKAGEKITGFICFAP